MAHFRTANPTLRLLAANDQLLSHPLVVIELACGTPPAPRKRTLGDLQKLQRAVVATTDEILTLIETKRCYDAGCGAVDIALLASVLLTADTRLWTMDKNLAALATSLGVNFSAEH